MDFLGQTWVLSKTVVTIAYSDPYETILEGNKKNVEKFQESILQCPIIFDSKKFKISIWLSVLLAVLKLNPLIFDSQFSLKELPS